MLKDIFVPAARKRETEQGARYYKHTPPVLPSTRPPALPLVLSANHLFPLKKRTQIRQNRNSFYNSKPI
jgi:hypothetical protein